MPAPITGALADMFPDTVVWEAVTPGGGIGSDTTAAPVNLTCRVSGKIRRVRGLDGVERVSTVMMVVPSTPGIKTGDLITLPTRFDPRQPSIIAVAKQTDENGAHHETVYFA